MKIYKNNTLKEWSNVLQAKYGTRFRLYNDDKETLERWHEHLSTLLGYKFEIKEDQEKTLEAWSKLIGG